MPDPIKPRNGARPYPTHTRLGRLMAERGLTAHEVCHAARVYPRAMTEFLAGRKRPTVAVLARLAHALDVEPDTLLGLVNETRGKEAG